MFKHNTLAEVVNDIASFSVFKHRSENESVAMLEVRVQDNINAMSNVELIELISRAFERENNM